MKPTLKLILGVAVLSIAPILSFAYDGAFITNPSGPDSITRDQVKGILLGTITKWDAGGIVKLAVLTEGPVHEGIIQEFTARSADQFEKYWKKQVFTGKGSAPESMGSDPDMIAYVAKTPGSFGYVSTTTPGSGVKVLQIK